MINLFGNKTRCSDESPYQGPREGILRGLNRFRGLNMLKTKSRAIFGMIWYGYILEIIGEV